VVDLSASPGQGVECGETSRGTRGGWDSRQQKRIPGPPLDRIDIHIEVPRLEYEELTDERLGDRSEDFSLIWARHFCPCWKESLDTPVARMQTLWR
jgi:hypothetical protein